MTLEERGAYITLLCHLWIEGWLPNGSTKLERLCGNPHNWNEIWSNIRHCFYENGNKLYHKRLEEEKEKQRIWREKSREGGIKSGEVRRGNKPRKGTSTTLQPPYEPKANTSSSSFKEYIVQIIKHWNTRNIKNLEDRETKVKKKTAVKINTILKDYSVIEIIEAIDNYHDVVKSSEYFFSYEWQLWEFIDRGIPNFLSKNNPKDNYLIDKKKTKTQEEIDIEIFKEVR